MLVDGCRNVSAPALERLEYAKLGTEIAAEALHLPLGAGASMEDCDPLSFMAVLARGYRLHAVKLWRRLVVSLL